MEHNIKDNNTQNTLIHRSQSETYESSICIIKGDISGIQEYIFNVSSKGAAKSLHEHSVNILKLEDKYQKRLKKDLQIGDDIISFKGGGGFHFFLKNKNIFEIEDKLRTIQNAINNDLKNASVTIRLSYGEGNTFKKAWESLRQNINKKRYQLYGDISKDTYEELKPFQTFEKNDSNLDDLLQEEAPVNIIENQCWTNDLINRQTKQEESNNTAPEIGNYIDFDGYASFARLRTGTDLLGVLKMDVDNLGKLFGNCDNEKDFSRLSDFFNDFFGQKGIVGVLRKDFECKFGTQWTYHENIYTVFAGGDDCFFIGAWDAILNFAEIIHSEFEKLVKEEINTKDLEGKTITLSAGIVLLDPKTPVVQLGKMAEDALSNAKSVHGKNAVCLMNEIFTWKEYNSILEQTETLVGLLKDEKISRALLEKIKKSSIGFDRLQQRIKRGESLPFDRVYKLKYYLRDIRKKEYADEVENKIFSPYIKALTDALNIKDDNLQNKQFTNPMCFPCTARLTEFKTRIINTNRHE